MGTKNIRQLAAVMFTDIEGYTAAMQEDEKNASKQRVRHRKALEKRASEFDGTPLHYYGDGALTIFNSAYNAVMCGIKIQQDLRSPLLPLRIGIHLGDIAYNEEEVFGDAVNIAARLEDLSAPGGIMISDKVKAEIVNHPRIKTKALGDFQLKNVRKTIAVHAISNKELKIPSIREVEKKTARLSNKIAVLPFVNMSDEIGFDYFSDGLTEEIINGLTKLKSLEVTSRTSAFSYKGLNYDVREIGDKLSVSHILEGSVRKFKDKIRVTAQLIETNQGFHLWSETYDGHLKDIFKIQDVISDKILKKFEAGLAKELESIDGSLNETVNNEAYEYYLEGRFYWDKATIPSVRKAVDIFKKAIELDPQFEKPYLDIALCYCYLGVMGQGSPQLAFERAEKYLGSVKATGSEREQINAISGIIQLFLHRDFAEAHRYFSKSVEEDHKIAKVYYLYAMYLNIIGQSDIALQWMERALKEEETNLTYNAGLAYTFYYARRYDEALEQFNYTLELDSAFLPAINGKGWVHVAQENLNEARRIFEIYQNLVSHQQENVPQLVYLAARLGMGNIATHFLDLLQLGGSEDKYNTTSLDIALIYMGMQKYDEVFFHLKRAAEDKVGNILFIDADPVWDKIKSDVRYTELKETLGFNKSVQSWVPSSFQNN